MLAKGTRSQQVEPAQAGGQTCCLRGSQWVELSEPTGAHIVTPLALNQEHEASGFNGFPVGLWSFFEPSLSFYTPTLFPWVWDVYSVPLYIGSM